MNEIYSKNLVLHHENLMVMIDNNDVSSVEALLKTINQEISDEKKSLAFLNACKSGRLEIAKILLNTINPKVRFADGQTALMLLSQLENETENKVEFMEFLMERGCDADLVDFCGKSALHWAVIKNCIKSTRLLINRCNINSADLLGMTSLMYAAKSNFSTIVSVLVHAGADPIKCYKQHGSAIHLAVRYIASDSLQQMIPFCRHFNVLDSHNQSPLDLAILLNHYEMLRIIIDSKKEVEINRRPNSAPFRTPLEEACFKNNFEITNLLLLSGADANYPLEYEFENDKGICRSKPVAAIMLAISKENVKLVELLLSAGADTDVCCPKAPGHVIMTNPLAFAAELGNLKIINLLEKHKESFNESIIEQSFISACHANDINVVLHFLDKYSIFPSQYKLKNGLPVILELVKHCMNNSDMDKIFDLKTDIIGDIFSPKIVDSLSRRNFGSSMQLYREAWIKLAIGYKSGQLEIFKSDEIFYLNFIISFLEYFFLKKKIEDLGLIQQKLNQLQIFPRRLVRYAVHSSRLIKAILLSKSVYTLIFLTEFHLDENLIFWDKKSQKILDLCEFSLFFDNIEAALILNLTCGISLNFLIEYSTFPFVPEIINPNVEYNDVDKISALKYLSTNVKPLKSLCKYAIRKFVDSDLFLIGLPGLSRPILDDLYLDLSTIGFVYLKMTVMLSKYISNSFRNQLSVVVDSNYLPTDEEVYTYSSNFDYQRKSEKDVQHLKLQKDNKDVLEEKFISLKSDLSELKIINQILNDLQKLNKEELKSELLLSKNNQTNNPIISYSALHTSVRNTHSNSSCDFHYHQTIGYNRSKSDGSCFEAKVENWHEKNEYSTRTRTNPNMISRKDYEKMVRNPSGNWKCRRCTILNPNSISTCECGSTRPNH